MVYPARKRPSAAVRATVAHRQDYKCAACGDKLPVAWHIDHAVPLSSPRWRDYICDASATAAANAISNLQALCPNCHGHKTLLESSEPSLLNQSGLCSAQSTEHLWSPSTSKIPTRARRPPRPSPTLSLAATNIRRRSIIDTIWAKSASCDPLTDLLLEPSRWKRLAEATTTKELRTIYKEIRKKRMIDFSTFKRRVEHLLAS